MFNLKTALASASFVTLMAATAQADILNKEIFDETATIAENAGNTSSFSTLLTAAQTAGLADDLMGPGPFTLFAPTDEAFAALPEGTVETLLMPENREQLATLLQAHIVPVILTGAELEEAFAGMEEGIMNEAEGYMLSNVNTVVADTLTEDADVALERIGETVFISSVAPGGVVLKEDSPRVIGTDIVSSNGVIHVIDGVLMPTM
ncbi:MAG: fasciclin domain-containing protein [Shimia sp.]